MPNRLAAEKSPYLRQHADNPVDWFPWGEAALARAREEGKPLFLSIGYSTCHWCHVMAHESFENPAVAEVLNRSFVPVKVDREERPDLDRVYMTYVQQTTGHGGWPMSVWLTPEGKPFYGGTYFPPEDRHGRPGFVTLLNTIARHWYEQRAKIESGAEEVVQALRRYAAEGGPRETREEGGPPPLHEAGGAAFDGGLNYFHEAYDPQWGGFGGAPKFPRASVIDFLFRAAVLQGVQSESGAEAVRMAAHTLQKMAEGGLHDHVGGGFHRYSVDERWHVPHFEKMLYDQALIAGNFLEAMQITGRPAFGWAARDIFAYVRRDLLGPHGGFYSAEDADSTVPEATVGRVVPDEPSVEPGNGSAGGFALPKSKTHIAQAEGAFYVWTKEEIVRVLRDDAEFFFAHFGVKPSGNVQQDPHGEFTGKNILMQQQSLAQTARDFHLELPEAEEKLASALERLRETRAQRPRPHLDDKVITAWNGLMISAFARGYQLFGATPENDTKERAGWLELANRAAEFIERELYDAATGTLYRSWRHGRSDIPAFAEDHAFLIQGLLDLYEAGFEIRWLQWAERLQAKMDELFWDAERGGYFSSRAGDPTVILRLKEDYDGAEPAANSIAAQNLLRLDWMIGGVGRIVPDEPPKPGSSGGLALPYRDHALRTIEAFRRQWGRLPQAMPELLCAVELALAEPRTVVLAGDPASEDFRVMAAVLREKAGPRRAILCADGGLGQAWLAARAPWLAEMHPKDGRATAYVCERHVCRPPVNDPAVLRAELR